jgi:pimeloyl-ACP methyl ester carboxylesterase
MKEQAVLFGEKRSLVGIVTEPPAGVRPRETAAILLNSGVLHRVAPGRINVRLARALADLGLTALRFDFSGIGDSKPRMDNLPFEKSSVDEARRAMDLLESTRGIKRFILLGGCSGARVSLATACHDQRVVAGFLMNFPVAPHDDETVHPILEKRKDEHYYLNLAIRDAQSWRKFFAGEAHYRRILGALAFSLRRRFVSEKAIAAEWAALRRDLDAAVRNGARPVFVCSKGDPSLQDLRKAGGRDLSELCSSGKAEIVVIPRSDHTFSSLYDQARLIEVVRTKAIEIADPGALLGAPLPLDPPDLWLPTRGDCLSEQQASRKSL